MLKGSGRVTAPPTGVQQESQLWSERETVLPAFTIVSVTINFLQTALQFHCTFKKREVYLGLIPEAMRSFQPCPIHPSSCDVSRIWGCILPSLSKKGGDPVGKAKMVTRAPRDLEVRLGWEQGEPGGRRKAAVPLAVFPAASLLSIVVLAHQQINEAIDFARGGDINKSNFLALLPLKSNPVGRERLLS